MLETNDTCTLCGWTGVFKRNHNSIREGYCCENCKASLRYREQAKFIVDKIKEKKCKSKFKEIVIKKLIRFHCSSTLEDIVKKSVCKDIVIYEPGIVGPFRRYFKRLPTYIMSYYWNEVELGVKKNDVRTENLEQLTFPDASFDFVITSDILEHVRNGRITVLK